MTLVNWLDLLDSNLWQDPDKQPEHGRIAAGDRIATAGSVTELAKAHEEETRKGMEEDKALEKAAADKAREEEAKERTKKVSDGGKSSVDTGDTVGEEVKRGQKPLDAASQDTKGPSMEEAATSSEDLVIEEVFDADFDPGLGNT